MSSPPAFGEGVLFEKLVSRRRAPSPPLGRAEPSCCESVIYGENRRYTATAHLPTRSIWPQSNPKEESIMSHTLFRTFSAAILAALLLALAPVQ
ncbi:MAG: hypothetical protein PVF51_13340, partial [Nitrospirota bacterium]